MQQVTSIYRDRGYHLHARIPTACVLPSQIYVVGYDSEIVGGSK